MSVVSDKVAAMVQCENESRGTAVEAAWIPNANQTQQWCVGVAWESDTLIPSCARKHEILGRQADACISSVCRIDLGPAPIAVLGRLNWLFCL